MKYLGYQCEHFLEWRKILSEKMDSAKTFEIHCWKDEGEAIALAKKYSHGKIDSWSYGKIIKGKVTPAFKAMLLDMDPLQLKEQQHTIFFSIFFDNGFSSEHYGYELNDLEEKDGEED